MGDGTSETRYYYPSVNASNALVCGLRARVVALFRHAMRDGDSDLVRFMLQEQSPPVERILCGVAEEDAALATYTQIFCGRAVATFCETYKELIVAYADLRRKRVIPAAGLCNAPYAPMSPLGRLVDPIPTDTV